MCMCLFVCVYKLRQTHTYVYVCVCTGINQCFPVSMITSAITFFFLPKCLRNSNCTSKNKQTKKALSATNKREKLHRRQPHEEMSISKYKRI